MTAAAIRPRVMYLKTNLIELRMLDYEDSIQDINKNVTITKIAYSENGLTSHVTIILHWLIIGILMGKIRHA
jgi:hypothetical protein